MSCFFIYVNSRIKGKMLPSSLECDDILWWRIDALWWSFILLKAFLAWAVHEHLVSYIALLLSHFFIMPSLLSFLLWILTLCLDLLLLSFLSVRASWLWVHWARPLLAFSFSLHHPILEMKIRTIACSSSINLSWYLLILGWRVRVQWRCKLKFLLDCLVFLRHGGELIFFVC